MAESSRKASDSFPSVKQSRVAQATGAENSSRLTIGAVYTAQIKSRQGDGTYTVSVADPREELHGVRLAAPVMGGLLGLNVRCELPEQTMVKIAYGSPSFIFCVIPANNPDWLNAKTRSLVWGPNMDKEVGVTANEYANTAEDMLEGEVEISNLFGVSLEFLTTLMRMRAGDRAAVECHLINDMVRVISAQYRHISGLGEDLIFDHGRPTMERSWSMYRHEVIGALRENESLVLAGEGEDMNGDEVNREKMEEKRVTSLGRHRFREFVGFAGDFVHTFVTDPPATIVSLGTSLSSVAAGKSWLHQNTDGSVLVQSVADIRLERVCRIPVPMRKAGHEDPLVTANRNYDELTAAYLKLPKAVNPVDPLDAYQMAYHIRSYSRWLGRYHSFARMLQLSGEYEILSEKDSPAPDWRNDEEDRKDQNGRADYMDEINDRQVLYYDAYACISIIRDGSIVLHDGYGSSIVASNGNVQVSATKHIDLEAAGDIRMVAGGSIMMKARRNIELSATLGGIVMYGYAWLKAFCEKGTVWLRSNAKTGKNEPPPVPKDTGGEGGPVPEVAGYVAGEEDGFAVLIEAAEGHAAYRSQLGAYLVVDGSPSSPADTSCNLIVSTGGDLDLRGRRQADLRSGGAVRVRSANTVALSCSSLLTDAREFIMGSNMASPDLIVRAKKLWCRNIHAEDLVGNRITGPERGYSLLDPDPQPAGQLKPHLNHIDAFRDNTPPPTPAAATVAQQQFMAAASAISSTPPGTPWTSSGDGPLWGFPEKEEYVWNNREKSDGGVPETLTQQYLRLDAEVDDPDRWKGPGYEDWNLRTPVSGKRVRQSGGYGYYELLYRASDAGDNLHEPSPKQPAGHSDVPVAWRPSGNPMIKALKRESEP